jgi:hypothetical protein
VNGAPRFEKRGLLQRPSADRYRCGVREHGKSALRSGHSRSSELSGLAVGPLPDSLQIAIYYNETLCKYFEIQDDPLFFLAIVRFK